MYQLLNEDSIVLLLLLLEVEPQPTIVQANYREVQTRLFSRLQVQVSLLKVLKPLNDEVNLENVALKQGLSLIVVSYSYLI